MLMAEEFARCKECNEGWFEKKVHVLVRKDVPLQWGKPELYREQVSFICIKCGYVQYQYIEE